MRHLKTITIDQLKPGMFIVRMDQPWYRTPFLLHKRFIRHTKDIDLLRQHGIRELKIDVHQGLDVEPVQSGDEHPPSTVEEKSATAKPSEAVQPLSPEAAPQSPSSAEMQAVHPQQPDAQQGPPSPSKVQEPAAATKPVSSITAPQHTPTTEMKTVQPQSPNAQQNPPSSSKAQETTAAPQPNQAMQLASPETAEQSASTMEMKAAQPPDTQHDPPTPPNTGEQIVAAQETYKEAICSMERMFEELEAGIVPRPDTLQRVVADVLTRVLDDDASMLSLLSFQKMKRFDRTLASHALDVCTLSLIVAHDYGIAEEDLESLGAGALLHDIGYVRLPRNLYRRNHDLSEQESSMMQQHAALGLAMLQQAKESRKAIVRIVAEHHECSDGSGFPRKLTGDSISVMAQLVGLVDLYDGMVSRRGGRPAMLPHDAIRQLFRLGDTGQYPKELIQTMIGSLGVYPIGSLVRMNTGEQAVVVGMNYTQRLKPIVKVITGPQGGSYITPIRVDLGAQAAGTMTRTITKVLDPLHERVNVAMFLDGIHEEAA
jgi:putative nucleotidyltransferase with HDIG domain